MAFPIFDWIPNLPSLSLSEGITHLEPLLTFVIGIVIYSFVIFKFYSFISKREIFKLKWKASRKSKALYVIEYIFLFPIVALLWVFVIALILSLISKIVVIDNILLVSMGMVASIRILSYYTEELSKEVAKLLPIVLLGIFLLDIGGLSISSIREVITSLPSLSGKLFYYFGFLIIMEFVLKVASFFHGGRKKRKGTY